MESVLVDHSEIRSVCRTENGVCDVAPHNHRDIRRDCLLDADCCQAGRILSVCLVLGIGVGCDILSDNPVCCAARGRLCKLLFLYVALLDRDVRFLFCQLVWDLADEPGHAIR